MEIPKRITFIDVQGKKYVLPVKIMVSRFILERFFQHAPPREKDSTLDDAILKFPDRPDTVEVMVQVLQHGDFHPPPHWESRVLRNLLDVVRAGEKYHVYRMVRSAVTHFENHVKLYDNHIPNTQYGDFSKAVELLYMPVMPEGWETIPGALFFSKPALGKKNFIPLLKRYAVQFAVKNHDKLAREDAFMDLFDLDNIMFQGPHPFCKDVQKARKRQKDADTKSKGKKGEMDKKDWSDFFAEERYVTIFECESDDYREYLLRRKDVLEQSTFLYEHAPEALPSNRHKDDSFIDETFELPDHPHGVQAMAAMIDKGPRHFDVPDDVQSEDLAVQYLSHALATGEKYGVFGMRAAVNGLLGSMDYIGRCRKPSTIVDAAKTVYTLKHYAEDGGLLRELKDKFVEWAVKRGEGWDENAFRRVCKKVPAFEKDVRKAEEEKKRRAAEEGGKKDKNVNGGAAADGQREE